MFLGTKSVNQIKKIKNKNQNTHISLFTGCGGLDVGFSRAGWHTRVMIEIGKDACATLRANFTMAGHVESVNARINEVKRTWRGVKTKRTFQQPMTEKERDETIAELEKWRDTIPGDWYRKDEPVIMERDIKTVSVEEILKAAKMEIGECGIVTGGFPCQGFSTAGPRIIDDPRNSLYKECVRMIRGIMPRFFCLENVRGLISMDKGKIINQICSDLAESGYTVSWQLLDAADYGVPQHRERVIFIGERNDVARLAENGRAQYFIGGAFGPVKHPDFYMEKYNIQNKYAEQYQQKLL